MTEVFCFGSSYFSTSLNSDSEYSPPEWMKQPICSHVVAPKHRVKLAMPNTPIHPWHLPGVPPDFDIYIKRDDMTGCTLSGNKVRKLEFILADALQQGCKHIITCGGHQSNHCRATATAAAQLGMKCHIFLRARGDVSNEKSCEGNMFLNRMFGADIYYTPWVAPYETHLKPRMERLAKKIKEETGEKAYLIPVGGSTLAGLFGYVEGFRELEEQGALDHITDIVFPSGSGGTSVGLSISNYLTGSKFKIHPIAINFNAKYMHEHANATYQELHINDVKSEDLMDVMEGHIGRGYGVSSDDELDFICDATAKTGIMLDQTYTGKAALGLTKELNKNPQRFKGNKILFIHTGGVFGAYDGTLNTSLLKNTAASKSYSWAETDSPPVKIN